MFYVLVVITSALTVQAEIRLPQLKPIVQPIVRPMTKSIENMHREHISSQPMLKPLSARDRIRHTLETFLPSPTMGHNLFLHAATKVKTLFQRSHLAPQAAWQSTGDAITVFGIEGDECVHKCSAMDPNLNGIWNPNRIRTDFEIIPSHSVLG